MSSPRAVVVSRPTELEHLVARHGTREQARFVLRAKGQDLSELEARHQRMAAVMTAASQAIPSAWRRARVSRDDLCRVVWEPGDVVVVVGQDGLVANVAKYLSGQPVIGVNPDPARIDGVLVRFPVEALAALLPRAASGRAALEERTLVQAEVDDGQRLRALNEVFLGHRSHQSARYRLRCGGVEERQSSSGLIVTTGTGASGWARSIARERASSAPLPGPSERALTFFVREAFPSKTTGTSLTAGCLSASDELVLTSELDEGGVVFGDGIEEDRLRVGWGVKVRVRCADDRLRLVTRD